MNIERLKREAKKLKKAEGIPHNEALNRLAKTYGYTSWALLMRTENRAAKAAAGGAQ